MSVILMSPEKRLPGADTTTNFLRGSLSIMPLTFLNWAASARDVPPNFTQIICKSFAEVISRSFRGGVSRPRDPVSVTIHIL